MDEMMMQQALGQAADAGRGGDTVLAHMTIGEVVIPAPMMQDPEVAQVIQAIFEAYGENLGEFTVGDQANKINPETGYPEFGFFKSIKKFFKKIAPIALPILGSMIPGVGTALGAALGGAAGGLVSGGGLKGALTGGALGGIGGYLSGGASGLLGHAAGTPLSTVTGNAALQGATQGTGMMGALTGGGLSSLTSGGGGLSNLSSLARIGGSIYGDDQESDVEKRARDAMLGSTTQAKNAIAPYSQMGLQAQQQLSDNLTQGFDPGDLTSDPSYQFRLNEGMKQRERALAASGMGQSGAAVKEAEQYGQGFASQEYSNAYDRWLAQNNQLSGVAGRGYNAAGSTGALDLNSGNVNASYALTAAERKNKTLASILAGLGL